MLLQCRQNRVGGARHQPVLVSIFHTHDKLSAVTLGEEPIEQGGPDIADVGKAGWARGKTDTNIVCPS